MMKDDIPHVEVKSRGELRAWLSANHLTHGPIWPQKTRDKRIQIPVEKSAQNIRPR